MTTDTEVTDVTVVTELANKNGETGQSEVEKEKEMDVLLIQIKSRKRTAKTKITKLRHELERLCVKNTEVTVIESVIEQLWAALADVQEVLEELTTFYVEVGDQAGKNEAFEEYETIEKDVEKAIEAGQSEIKVRASKTVNMNRPITENTMDRFEQPARQYQQNEIQGHHDDRNRFLKPLKIPTFNGEKRKFEDFWALFRSLVDESTEPANLKMARLR